MNPKIEHFLSKHGIAPRDIKYILREDGKTVVHTLDGRAVPTYYPVKEFRESLSREDFFHPNKGILLAASQIVDVSDGAYTLADGRKFRYRVHNSQLHDSRMLQLGRQMESLHAVLDNPTHSSIRSQFAILDKLPMAVTVIELIYDEHGFGADFFFRYANAEMARLEGIPVESLLDHSCLELFRDIDRKWLVILADVALNDSVRIIDAFHARLKRHILAYCFQPMPDYCVCFMTTREPNADSLPQVLLP